MFNNPKKLEKIHLLKVLSFIKKKYNKNLDLVKNVLDENILFKFKILYNKNTKVGASLVG